MRLLVTVDNYNHTHEHLFEFGVQHAEIANFTIQRLRNPAVSDGGHGRRVMIVAPTLGVRNLHLVAEHIPDHAWLLPRVQRLDHGHILPVWASVDHATANDRRIRRSPLQ